MKLPWLRTQYARAAVTDALLRGEDPAREDLDAALEDIPGQPIPRMIVDYPRRAYVRAAEPRGPGPIAGRKTAARDLLVRA